MFPEDEVNDIRISRKPNAAYLDNLNYGVQYVPMSEVFDINVPKSEGVDRFQTANLFITRSVIKFSFCFMTEEGYSQSGVKIAGVKIYGLADEGYFIPRDTHYDPEKYQFDASGFRVINQFETPDVTYSDYDFPFMIQPPEIKAGLDVVYAPVVYFPESKCAAGSSYKVSVTLDDTNEFLTPQPLEIRDIPRNTHVKINVIMRSTGISPEVELLPYTGVYLYPLFGL